MIRVAKLALSTRNGSGSSRRAGAGIHCATVGPAHAGNGARESDQLGELGRNVCHRPFCSAQAASGGERVVHDGNCSRARSAQSSLSAMPSAGRRCSSAGVTSTIPTRDFAKPLSMARSNGVPRPTSFSLNQTETPSDSGRSWSSLAAPYRSSHACQRKTSRRSGRDARSSTVSQIGASARTSVSEYTKDEPARDHHGLFLLPDPAAAALSGSAAPRRGVRRGRVRPVAAGSRCSDHSGRSMQGRGSAR